MKHVRHMTLWPLVIVMAMILMASSSPQCARTSDVLQPTPADENLDAQTFDSCTLGCWSAWFSALVDESRRYRRARRDCNWNWDCISRERAIHLAILADLKAQRNACITACEHQQGSGTGGQ